MNTTQLFNKMWSLQKLQDVSQLDCSDRSHASPSSLSLLSLAHSTSLFHSTQQVKRKKTISSGRSCCSNILLLVQRFTLLFCCVLTGGAQIRSWLVDLFWSWDFNRSRLNGLAAIHTCQMSASFYWPGRCRLTFSPCVLDFRLSDIQYDKHCNIFSFHLHSGNILHLIITYILPSSLYEINS